MMTKANFKWLVVDMDHTAVNDDKSLNLIQIILSNGLAPLMRMAANDLLLIKRVMDAGPQGILSQ